MKIFDSDPKVLLACYAFFTLQIFVMRTSINLSTRLLLFSLVIFISCQKETEKNPVSQEEIQTSPANKCNGHLKQAKTFSSDVAQKWVALQIRMLRLPAGPNIYGRNG